MVVQAHKILGENDVDKSVPATLRKKLNPTDRNRAVREARYVTSWIYEIIKQLAAEDKSPKFIDSFLDSLPNPLFFFFR